MSRYQLAVMICVFRQPRPLHGALGLGLASVRARWRRRCSLSACPGGCLSPADYQQGETVRIMYVHVPAAWWSLGIYAFMAGASFIGLVWRHALADVAARAAAPIGATFAALCLVTGSLWGAPTWGTWWEWDGRLTSMLVLFVIYLGYLALWARSRTKRAPAAGGDPLSRRPRQLADRAFLGRMVVHAASAGEHSAHRRLGRSCSPCWGRCSPWRARISACSPRC